MFRKITSKVKCYKIGNEHDLALDVIPESGNNIEGISSKFITGITSKAKSCPFPIETLNFSMGANNVYKCFGILSKNVLE